MGSWNREYSVTCSSAPWRVLAGRPRPRPRSGRDARRCSAPCGTTWQGPCGSSSLVALASSQETAPQRPRRSGRDDADVAGGEGLAHDAGVEHDPRTRRSWCARRSSRRVEHLDWPSARRSLFFVAIDARSVTWHLSTTVSNSLLILAYSTSPRCWRKRKPASKSALRNADTDHVALAGVHNALDAVEEGVDLALHNGLEVGLHVLARDLDDVGTGRSWSRRGSRRARGRPPMILWSSISASVSRGCTSSKQSTREPSTSTCMSPLRMISPSKAEAKATGMSMLVILILMSRASREVAFHLRECPAAWIRDLGHGNMFSVSLVITGKPRQMAPAPQDDDVVGQGLVGVDERVDAVHGVLGQRGLKSPGVMLPKIRAARTATETTWITDCDVLAQQAPRGRCRPVLHARASKPCSMDAADEGDENALRSDSTWHRADSLLGGGGRAADDNGNAGDVAGDQRHAQITDDGVGQVARSRLRLIGRRRRARYFSASINSAHRADAYAGLSKASWRRWLAGHHGLDGRPIACLQLAEGGDLHAGDAVVAGQAVSGAGEGHGLAFAVQRRWPYQWRLQSRA